MPVYADMLGKELRERGMIGNNESVPGNERGICYIPGIPNEFMYHMTRTYGTPLSEMVQRDKLVVVITPPLACFDNHHLLGAKVVRDTNTMEPLMVLHKEDPPPTLDFDANTAFCHMHCAMSKLYADNPYDLVGARLNPLSSGLQNIVCYVQMSEKINETEQLYIDTSEVVTHLTDGHKTYVRTRIIPMPSLDALNDNAYSIHIKIKEGQESYVYNNDNFTKIFGGGQALVNEIFGGELNFRHAKVNRTRGEVIIGVHDTGFRFETNIIADMLQNDIIKLDAFMGFAAESVEVDRVVTL